MALEKIIEFLKSPIFLISLSLITLSVIYVVVTKSPTVTTSTVGPKCPSGLSITCPDGTLQCGENCPVNQQWDCSTKKCICANANDKLCVNNTQCCNPCDNDICCSESNQITKNGVKSCCPPGTQPGKSSSSSTVNDMCAVPCGNTVCNEGEQCIKVSNLKQTTYDNLVRTKGSELTGSDPTTNTLTFCAQPSTCSFGDEQAYPPSQDNAYPYLNNLPTSVCIAQDSSAKSSPCFSKTGKSDCNNTAGCIFLNLPDDFNPAIQNQLNNYMNSKSTNGSSPYYCDPNGLSLGRLVQYRSSTGNCSWQDCIQQISSAGTIDTIWNDNTQTCTAYKVPPYENIGSQPLQKIQCTGSGSPCSSCGSNTDFVSGIKCTAPGFPCSNCKKEGDYVCIQDGDVCEPVSSGGSGTNNWTFNKCAPDSNGKKVQVLGPGGGNCPWGCSSTSGTGLGGGNCYNTDIPPGSGNVFGDVNPGTNQVCLQNGQINTQPTNPPISYNYDKTNLVCSQISSSSGNYRSLCDCVNDIYNGNIAVSLTDNAVGFLIYQKQNDGTRQYMYYKYGERWFNYTTNIDDPNLGKGNLNFMADGTGKTLLNGYGFGIAYSNGKFQFLTAYDGSAAATSNPYGIFNTYSQAMLKDIDNVKRLYYNTGYQFTYPYGDRLYGPTTNLVNNQMTNQSIGNMEQGNYIYLTRYEIEKQKINNC